MENSGFVVNIFVLKNVFLFCECHQDLLHGVHEGEGALKGSIGVDISDKKRFEKEHKFHKISEICVAFYKFVIVLHALKLLEALIHVVSHSLEDFSHDI